MKKTKRPSRKGIEITKHKGGRTERFEARFTPAEKAAIEKKRRASGLSSADWLLQVSGLTDILSARTSLSSADWLVQISGIN